MASAHSPIMSPCTVPTGAKGRSSPTMRSTAISETGSVPITVASKSRPSGSVTRIWSAPVITWSFVRTIPSLRTITPEPKPALRRSPPGGMKKLSYRVRT